MIKSDRARFFRKTLIFQKMGKKGPKRPKNRVFGLLSKIESLPFARNDLKWSVIWLANFLRKSHIWENSRSRDLGQRAPKKGKNRDFGLLRKMPIYNTTAKDFENLISYLNSSWEMYFHFDMDHFFSYLVTSSPLKMGENFSNIYFKNWFIFKLLYISFEPLNLFLDPRLLTGWILWIQVRPCVRLGIGSLVFSDILHEVRGP